MNKALSYTLFFIGIQMLSTTLVVGCVKLLGSDAMMQSPYISIASMALFAITSIAVFLYFGWAKATPDFLRSRPWGVLVWSVLASIGVVVPSMAFQEQLPDLPNIVEDEPMEIISHKGGYFVICLLAPVAEELAFRGAVLRSLLNWKPQKHWAMIAISALLFSLVHMNPAQMPHAFLMGLLLGWMYYRTGSIVPGVVFHWTNNTIAFVLLKLYPDPDLHLIDILGNNRNIGAAIIFSLFILAPALYQLWLRMERK